MDEKVKIRYRNTAEVRFERKFRIAALIDTIVGAEELGWKLDISLHSEGLSMDTEGITVHLCKFSDEREEFDKNLAHISGFRIPSQKDLRDGVY